jgi:hypothetical protein
MDNAKGCFDHLWAAIQLLRTHEATLSDSQAVALMPVNDAILRLDFLAQKLIPYACSSFISCSSMAMMEMPFWNRQYLEFSGSSADPISTEQYRLIRLIASHNKLSRVVWGCWCPPDERPSRDELMGFNNEMCLWKANSPATWSHCLDFDSKDCNNLDSLPIPPPPLIILSNDAAINIAMYNSYLGCALAMISSTDEDPAARELETYQLVYNNLRICQGLIYSSRSDTRDSYMSCDAIGMGISLLLYHGARRCYSEAWQQHTIVALRSIGREGLSNGFTLANMLQIMMALQAASTQRNTDSPDYKFPEVSPLGSIRYRIIPLLMPPMDDDCQLAYYLQYGSCETPQDESVINIVAKATWRQDRTGIMETPKIDIYDSPSSPSDIPALDVGELFVPWRQHVEQGWHGYLAIRPPASVGKIN